MAYLGQSNSLYDPTRVTPRTVQTFSGDGVTTQFTLQFSVLQSIDIEVVVENVIQQPDYAYTAVGNILTFSSAPPVGSGNIYVGFDKITGLTGTVPDGSVTSSKLANNIRLLATDQFTGDGLTLNYTLSDYPADANSLIVTVNGISESAPTNYTVANNVLTFTAAPSSGAKIVVKNIGFRTTQTLYALQAGSRIVQPQILGGTANNVLSTNLTAVNVTINGGTANNIAIANSTFSGGLSGSNLIANTVPSSALTIGACRTNLSTEDWSYNFLQQKALMAVSNNTVISIPSMGIGIGGNVYSIPATTLNVNNTASWDSATYATAANRAGLDFYVYALTTGTFILSNNSTVPTGYTSSNSRKVGGFHCLCSSVGTISGHTLSGYVTGDILPLSVWDRYNRSAGRQAGTIKSASGKWVDIYLPSLSGSTLLSVYGATVTNGATSPAFHLYKYEQYFAAQNMRLIRQNEFVVTSLGSNQGTNITGSVQKTTTGGSVDTAGRRMISNEGVEDCCGSYWQWCADIGGISDAAGWSNAYDANDTGGVAGQSYQAPYRGRLGGAWFDGVFCGSRGSDWNVSPLALSSYISARGVAEPQNYIF